MFFAIKALQTQQKQELTSKIILCSPKQKVEPNGLVLLADDDLETDACEHAQFSPPPWQ